MLSKQRIHQINDLVDAGRENEIDPKELTEWSQQIEQEIENFRAKLQRRCPNWREVLRKYFKKELG